MYGNYKEYIKKISLILCAIFLLSNVKYADAFTLSNLESIKNDYEVITNVIESDNYLKESSVALSNGVILPDMNKALNDFSDKDFYYILYNKNRISANDKIALDDYSERLSDNNKYAVILTDVSNLNSAIDIYDYMKNASGKRKGKLKGIQIIGSSSDVPSFEVCFKVKQLNGIDEGAPFRSDLFYSNFDNDSRILADEISIYKSFEDKKHVNFIPKWSVDRLPLSAGEIAPFINKYYDYRTAVKSAKKVPFVNFSSPIFAQPIQGDDMGYFINERLNKEFKLLKKSDYRLYGSKEGLYPVKTQVAGDFDNKNLKLENEKGIANFIINSHGSPNDIFKCVFIKPGDLAKYKSRLSIYGHNGSLLEVNISVLNNMNINTVLSKNYYTLILWACNNAYDLRSDTLVNVALKGKAIDAMAASHIISDNGINNKASLQNMKKNNLYYFFYEFFKYQSQGYSRSESFFNAKRLYATEILKHTDLLEEGNYGYNLHNVLSYHYLGLIDFPETQNKGKIILPNKDITNPYNIDRSNTKNNGKTETTDKDNTNPNKVESSEIGNLPGHVLFEDNNIQYKEIKYGFINPVKEYKVNFVGASSDSKYLYLKIKYYSPKDSALCIFLQGDAPGLKDLYKSGTKKGENTIILKFTKEEYKNYTAGLAVNVGDNNFISIKRETLFEITT